MTKLNFVIVAYFSLLNSFAFAAESVECATKYGVKVCVGDRTLVKARLDLGVTIAYVDVINILETDSKDIFQYGIIGKVVGDPNQTTVNYSHFKPLTGAVFGFPNLTYGEPVANIYGSEDIVLHYENGKYFVFLGDMGFAEPLTQRDLAKRLNIELPKPPNDSDRGTKCPDFDGKYELLSCRTNNKSGVFFWPYSSYEDVPTRRVTVEQIGCEKLEFSFAVQMRWDPSVSLFSTHSSASSFYYDLTKAKIRRRTVKLHSGSTEAGASWGSECLPLPMVGINNTTQDFRFSMDGDILRMKGKFVDKGLIFIIPYRDAQTVECELKRIE